MTKMLSPEEYEEWLKKFDCPKTTDECHTPHKVYEVVLDYVQKTYGVEAADVVRPFYPNGDYKAEDYSGKVVVDNPPFSQLGAIVDWYKANGVRFWLFAPALSLMHYLGKNVSLAVTNVQVVYANGAKVNTSFITNMEAKPTVFTEARLAQEIKRVQSQDKPAIVKNIYPKGVWIANQLAKAAEGGYEVRYEYEAQDVIRRMKDEEGNSVQIYGAALRIRDEEMNKAIEDVIARGGEKKTAKTIKRILKTE